MVRERIDQDSPPSLSAGATGWMDGFSAEKRPFRDKRREGGWHKSKSNIENSRLVVGELTFNTATVVKPEQTILKTEGKLRAVVMQIS